MKPQTFLYLLIASMVMFGCKGEDNGPAVQKEKTGYYDAHPEFNKVRKAIILEDGATVYVGSTGNKPAVLILEADFTERSYKTFDNNIPGDFFNVIERATGNIVAVGEGKGPLYDATLANENGGGVEFTKNGELVASFDMSGHESHITQQHDALSCAYESPNRELIVAGVFKAENIAITTYVIGPNDSRAGIYWLPGTPYIYPNGLISKGFDHFFTVGRRYELDGEYSTLYSANVKKDSMLAIDFTISNLNKLLNWTDASPESNPYIRAEVMEGGDNNCFVASLGSSEPYSISLTDLGFDHNVNSNWSYSGLGQAVFQNCNLFGNNFVIVGSTLASNEDFADGNYSAYICAVNPSTGEMLWDAHISEEGHAVTALATQETDEMIKVAGLILDSNQNARFVQWSFDKEGNRIDEE